jgi:signal transduction histidine kinase
MDGVAPQDQDIIAELKRKLNERTVERDELLEQQIATAGVLKVIASSPSDMKPAFEAIATSANRLIGGFSATVMRFIGDSLHLVASTSTNAAADEALKASFPRPLAEFPPFELVRDGETVQFADTEAADVPPVNRKLARFRGYRSMVFTPLMSNAGAIGILSVTRVQPGSFPAHHIQALQSFANQAVIALENVRLFDGVQAKTLDLSRALQQQTATSDVLKVISRSAFDLQTVFDTLTTSASALCEADQGIIFLRDGNVFRAHATFGASPALLEFLKANPRRLEYKSMVPRVARSGQVQHIPDKHLDPDYQFPGRSAFGDTRAALGVPLLRDGKVEGVFVLERFEPGSFTDQQIELLTTFADQAVIAISNVRLFEEVQQRTKELSKSLDELRTAQDRLVQTEKLASLGQLTAGIAHEIKNPLNFVNNFSALSAELTDELNDVLKPAALSDKIREEVDELTGLLKDNLEKVVQHGKRADSIVKNMLLHSREGSGDHRPADINALLDESLNLAYHGARAEKPQFNVTLQREFDATAGTLELFPQEITRVFLNLISNGFYAVTKRKTENGSSGFDPVLRATTRNLGDTVEIRIRDNGTGIPAEVKEKMFNPFFTTKPAGEGTGLGLSMSHDIIVKQHGGTIDVETEPGQFTEFRIVLPRSSNFSNKNRGQT